MGQRIKQKIASLSWKAKQTLLDLADLLFA
jgi:hypothetical protein